MCLAVIRTVREDDDSGQSHMMLNDLLTDVLAPSSTDAVTPRPPSNTAPSPITTSQVSLLLSSSSSEQCGTDASGFPRALAPGSCSFVG